MTARLDPTSHPGLAKARAAPLVVRRCIALVATVPGRWREVFEAADVVSEGQTRIEGSRQVYYGTTSLVLAPASRGGALPDARLDELADVLRCDPHARLLALRVAHREASSRSRSPLGTLRAELSFSVVRAGLSVAVDVAADVLGEGIFAAGS